MSLLKASKAGPTIVDVTPASAGWRYVGFRAHRLAPGERVAISMPGREFCIVVLSGRVDVRAGSNDVARRRRPRERVRRSPAVGGLPARRRGRRGDRAHGGGDRRRERARAAASCRRG